MVDDPIRLKRHGDDRDELYDMCQTFRGDNLFVVTNSGSSLFYVKADDVRSSRFSNPKLWCIAPGHGHYTYRINIYPLKKEQFVSYMMEHYPDHFEWLLFHPEWL